MADQKHDHDEHGAQGDHGHDEGGHEIDRMPNGRLFNLLFGLSALTLLSCIGVIQLFNMQVEALEHSRAEQGSFRIAEYIDEMNKQRSGWGKLDVKELDDKNTTTVRYSMPIASAKKSVLEDPNLLKALTPPNGWKTADDKAPAAPPGAAPAPAQPKGGAQPSGAAVPTDGAKPPEPTPAPKPDDAKGDDAKADDTKADDAKADDAKAEKPKPAKPRVRQPAPEPTPKPEPAGADAG